MVAWACDLSRGDVFWPKLFISNLPSLRLRVGLRLQEYLDKFGDDSLYHVLKSVGEEEGEANLRRTPIWACKMTWYDNHDEEKALEIILPNKENSTFSSSRYDQFKSIICPSCGHTIKPQDQSTGLQDLPGLPAGVKFDPTDQEILGHLEAKVLSDTRKLHPLIDEFIPTIEGENGICYTHPEKLPGVRKDGQVRHFFHRPLKAYTTGTRKRRKVHTDADAEGGCGGETRWHKTGKTRPVTTAGKIKGYKKILVLYTNYGRQRKPEKTNWVMHQYHLGDNEEERDGELVVSKVFYQTHPRQCGAPAMKEALINHANELSRSSNKKCASDERPYQYYDSSFISYNVGNQNVDIENPSPMIHNLGVLGDGSSFMLLPSSGSKGK